MNSVSDSMRASLLTNLRQNSPKPTPKSLSAKFDISEFKAHHSNMVSSADTVSVVRKEWKPVSAKFSADVDSANIWLNDLSYREPPLSLDINLPPFDLYPRYHPGSPPLFLPESEDLHCDQSLFASKAQSQYRFQGHVPQQPQGLYDPEPPYEDGPGHFEECNNVWAREIYSKGRNRLSFDTSVIESQHRRIAELESELRLTRAHLSFSNGRRALNLDRLYKIKSVLNHTLGDIENIQDQQHNPAGRAHAIYVAGFNAKLARQQLNDFAPQTDESLREEDQSELTLCQTIESGEDLDILNEIIEAEQFNFSSIASPVDASFFDFDQSYNIQAQLHGPREEMRSSDGGFSDSFPCVEKSSSSRTPYLKLGPLVNHIDGSNSKSDSHLNIHTFSAYTPSTRPPKTENVDEMVVQRDDPRGVPRQSSVTNTQSKIPDITVSSNYNSFSTSRAPNRVTRRRSTRKARGKGISIIDAFPQPKRP